MQILQWVSKRAHENEIERSSIISPTNLKDMRVEKAKGKDIITVKRYRRCRRTKRTKRRKLSCKNLKPFIFICGKDMPKACFYRNLNINRLGNLNMRRHFVHSIKMKREELSGRVGKRADFAAHVGKKVLPITEASFSNSTKGNDQFVTTETKANRKKPISRIKELLRRVAAAKTEKSEKFYEQKVLQFRRQGYIEEVPDYEQLISESPKISFSWDVETCMSENGQTQIPYSQFCITPELKSGQITYKKENWITTDSEFVVLEL